MSLPWSEMGKAFSVPFGRCCEQDKSGWQSDGLGPLEQASSGPHPAFFLSLIFSRQVEALIPRTLLQIVFLTATLAVFLRGK